MEDIRTKQDAFPSILVHGAAILGKESAATISLIEGLIEEMKSQIGADQLLFAFAHVDTHDILLCHCIPENDATLKERIPELLDCLSGAKQFPFVDRLGPVAMPCAISADEVPGDDRAGPVAAVCKIDETRVAMLMVALPQGAKTPDFIMLQFAVVSLAQSLEIQRLNWTLRQRESRIEKIEQTAALATLAYGMFHGLNNNLAVVQGYAEMVLNDTNQATPTHAFTEAIMEAGAHASETVEQLLAYRRLKRERTQAIDLSELLDHIDLPAQAGSGTATRVSLHAPHEELTFASNRKELAAALAGLCRKVGASIDKTDELVLEAGLSRIADDRPATRGYLQRGAYVRISLFGVSSHQPRAADFGSVESSARDPLRSDRELATLLATLQLLQATIDFQSTNARNYHLNIYFKTLAETT